MAEGPSRRNNSLSLRCAPKELRDGDLHASGTIVAARRAMAARGGIRMGHRPYATPPMPSGIPGPRRVRAPPSRHAKPLSAAQPPSARTRIRRIVSRAPDRVLRGLRICRSGLPKRWRDLSRQADLAHADLGLTAKTARSGTDRVLCIGFRSPKDRLRELRRKRPAEMPLTDHIDPLQAIHKTQSLPVSALFSAKPRLTEKMLIRGGF